MKEERLPKGFDETYPYDRADYHHFWRSTESPQGVSAGHIAASIVRNINHIRKFIATRFIPHTVSDNRLAKGRSLYQRVQLAWRRIIPGR